MNQIDFFEQSAEAPKDLQKIRSGAFTDNMRLPLHRWFRYSAGFSAEWAESVIKGFTPSKATSSVSVLDPFCGSGTTLIAAAASGANAVGFETHPFVARIASAKLRWDVDPVELREVSRRVQGVAKGRQADKPTTSSKLLLKCYDTYSLTALEALRAAFDTELGDTSSAGIRDLIWLAITCILRECSGVGTAQWQYVLPNKTKARVSDPFSAFSNRISMFREDLLFAKSFKGNGCVICTDARSPSHEGMFDLVITSPPYPNNYDYADATRLEMTFWGEVDSWGDLQKAVRQHLIRSCSQHSAAEKLQLDELLKDESISAIREELSAVCKELEVVRQNKGGKKTYHTMVAAYFCDLAKVWRSLRKCTNENARVAFVIGDSAPYGVYVPCDVWLSKLAIEAGFNQFEFDKLRDRNTKWKCRKHTVPLKEGILWVN